MEEFAYLANVLVAGHERNGSRLRPKEAADAVIATVCFGAVVELRNAHEFTVRDGVLIRFKVYGDRDEALDAAGLSDGERRGMP